MIFSQKLQVKQLHQPCASLCLKLKLSLNPKFALLRPFCEDFPCPDPPLRHPGRGSHVTGKRRGILWLDRFQLFPAAAVG